MPEILHTTHHIHHPLSRHCPSLAPWWHLSCQELTSLPNRWEPLGTCAWRQGLRCHALCARVAAQLNSSSAKNLPGSWQVAGKECNSGMITYDLPFQGILEGTKRPRVAQSQECAIILLLLEASQRSELCSIWLVCFGHSQLRSKTANQNQTAPNM